MSVLVKVRYVGLLLIITSFLTPLISYSNNSAGLTIVVTFPNLVDDISLVKCDLDTVHSLLPPSVDPHDYSLTLTDVKLLEQADLIISTVHTHFELRISELRDQGVIKAVILEIPKARGIKLLKNPSTGLPNLHMPIYDPNNYLEFLRNLTNTLKYLNPACAEVYEFKYESVRNKINELMSSVERLNLRGIGVKPMVQYAVSWLGINLTKLLIPEEDVSPTSGTMRDIEDQVRGGHVDVIVVTTEENTYVSYLKSLGSQYGIPVLEVPLPFSEGSIISKLENIVSQVTKIKTSTIIAKASLRECPNILLLTLLGSVTSLLLIWLVFHAVRSKRISASFRVSK
ncbi:MAG: zinc ABC transporter substrate-binding protein [Desulfurococcaceae archaeon TW002]